MGKKYDTYNHAKAHIRYHLIFTTKFRRNCLEGVKDDLLEILKGIEKRSHFRLIHIAIGADHIHLFVKSRPSISIEQIVRRLKQITTSEMWKKHEEYLRRFYWKRRKLWSNGYFCSTVGEMSEETVIKYISNQG